MDRNISTILADLYAIDPRFKKHEAEFASCISTLIKNRPQPSFNSSFQHQLRTDLIASMARSTAKTAGSIRPPVSFGQRILSPYRFFMSHSELRSSVLVAIIAILVVAPVTYVATEKKVQQPLNLKDLTSSLSQKQQITIKPSAAFGPIALAKTTTAAENQPTAKAAQASTALAATTTDTPVPAAARFSALSDTTVSDTIPATAATSHKAPAYSYYYSDEPLSLADEGDVFKKTLGTDASKALLDVLNGLHFDLTNLSSFTGLSVQTIRLNENKAYGYLLNVDINKGTINIFPDPNQWPVLKSGDTHLSDTDAISIATQFLADHGVDTKNYARPQIDPGIVSDGDMRVVLPLTIESLEVYNENATPYGITVTINASLKKVVSVENIMSQIYESSKYPLETDTAKIFSSINATSSSDISSSTTNLKKPDIILVHTIQADSATSTPVELFVPALYFTASSSDAKGPKAILVPLIKDTSTSAIISSTTSNT